MPDTPGAGHSAPLSKDEFGIDDLAHALRGFADALGLARVAVYGSHTGAAIACGFAAQNPGRVCGLVLDGISDWTAEERAANATAYAPPFRPVWDGSHMAWLWARMEAQSVWFPWYERDSSTWRGVPLSPPEHLHRNAMDMLSSGDSYRLLYRAALAFDAAPLLPRIEAPILLMTQRSDVLLSHAGRPGLRALPLRVFEGAAALHQSCAETLAGWDADPAPPAPPAGTDCVGLATGWSDDGEDALAWRGQLSGRGRPLVLLHPAGSSFRRFETILAALAGVRPVVAMDLPGHGLSAYGGGHAAGAEQIALRVGSAAHALGLEAPAVAGIRYGGVIAQALLGTGGCHCAADLGPRITSTAQRSELAAHGAVSLTPEWDGAHLLRAWRVAMRMAIWDPWYDTGAETSAQLGAAKLPQPASIQSAAIDLLVANVAWAEANALEAAAPQALTPSLDGQTAVLRNWGNSD